MSSIQIHTYLFFQSITGVFFRVACLGGHVLYKIEDSLIYPVSYTSSKPNNPDEGR